jgi:penicillin amidase
MENQTVSKKLLQVIRNAPLISRFLGVVLVPLLIGAWLVHHHLARNLPQQQTTLVSGVSAPVTITRDAHGVPQIEAKTDADAFFAIGYVHAEDRLWQLEVQRHLAQGRLSELFGSASVSQDVWFRSLGLYASAKTAWPALSKEAQGALTAYTAGINAAIAAQRSLPVEFTMLQVKPEPWTVYDSLAWIKVFALNLGVNFNSEVNRLIVQPALSAQQLKTLLPEYDSTAPITVRNMAKAPQVREGLGALVAFQKDALQHGLGLGGMGIGSNAWVVSGKLTGGKGALLANDPHLNLQMPSLWYVVSARGARLNVTGMSMVGLPLVIFGHNDQIAWGGTNMMADAQDLYFERPDPTDPTRYELNGKMVPFTTRTETITIRPDMPAFLSKDIKPIRIAVRSSVHGPIVSDQFHVFDQPMALRWTALDAGDTSFEAFYKLNYATDWAGFNAALAKHVAPALNMVYADRQGNIGYLGAGRVPVRQAGRGAVPSAGWSGAAEWTGYIPFDQLPRAYNPPAGYIVTANNRIVDDSYPYFISDDWAPPARARRIENLLQEHLARNKVLGARDMEQIQADTVDLDALAMLPELRQLKPANEEQARALAYLKAWDGDMNTDSQAAAIFSFWMRHLRAQLFAAGPGDFWNRPEQRQAIRALSERVEFAAMGKMVEHNDSGWCAAAKVGAQPSCTALLHDSLQAALDELGQLRGGSMDGWHWGSLQHAVFLHTPFSKMKPFDRFFERRVSTGGSINTINVAGASFENRYGFVQGLGAGFRQVVELAPAGVKLDYMNSTGQSGSLLSPHYDDMVVPFQKVTYYQLAQASRPAPAVAVAAHSLTK